MKQPPKYKTALLIWVALYPSLNVFLFIFGDALSTLPLLVRTFIISSVLVPLIAYVLMPFLTKTCATWLMK